MRKIHYLEARWNKNRRKFGKERSTPTKASSSLRFHIAMSEPSQFSGKMIRLDQGNTEAQLSSMTVEGSVLSMEFKEIGATFIGQLNERTKETVGRWKQGDKDYELTIKRVSSRAR